MAQPQGARRDCNQAGCQPRIHTYNVSLSCRATNDGNGTTVRSLQLEEETGWIEGVRAALCRRHRDRPGPDLKTICICADSAAEGDLDQSSGFHNIAIREEIGDASIYVDPSVYWACVLCRVVCEKKNELGVCVQEEKETRWPLKLTEERFRRVDLLLFAFISLHSNLCCKCRQVYHG